jgi:hypothetical protein
MIMTSRCVRFVGSAILVAGSLWFSVAQPTLAQSTNVQPVPAPTAAPSTAPAPGSGSASNPSSAPAGFGLRNPLGTTSVPIIIGRIVSWLGGFAGSLFFLYLLWGGVDWMLGGGDSKRVEKGKKKIVAAASGIAVILLAYMAVAAIIGAVPRALQ